MKYVFLTLAVLFCYVVFFLVVVGIVLFFGWSAFTILDAILSLL